MLRLLLVLLLVSFCSALQYILNVDAVNGQDVADCAYVEPFQNTVEPTIPCKTISYALQNPTQADAVELTIAPGTYTGTANTNININVQQFDIEGNSTFPNPPTIDCGSAPNTPVFILNPLVNNQFNKIAYIEFKNCNSGLGGAINIPVGTANVEIDSCIFINNRATQNGGAIYTKSYALTVSQCVFTNNSAANFGGAIYAQGQDIMVSSSTFYLNTASQGAAIYGQDIGTAGGILYFPNNNFTNNTAASQGGAFFADSTSTGSRTYNFAGSEFDNNCATSPYTDSYAVQVRCSGDCSISDKGNSSGCTDIETNIPTASSDDGHVSNKDRAIIIGVVVPFGILAILSIVLFLYIRKRHNDEMARRDEYRKKILRALENLPPEEQEAARLEAENADPSSPKCQLCQVRPINAPLPCGHEIVCSVCRTILLECPVKGCKKPTR